MSKNKTNKQHTRAHTHVPHLARVHPPVTSRTMWINRSSTTRLLRHCSNKTQSSWGENLRETKNRLEAKVQQNHLISLGFILSGGKKQPWRDGKVWLCCCQLLLCPIELSPSSPHSPASPPPPLFILSLSLLFLQLPFFSLLISLAMFYHLLISWHTDLFASAMFLLYISSVKIIEEKP